MLESIDIKSHIL